MLERERLGTRDEDRVVPHREALVAVRIRARIEHDDDVLQCVDGRGLDEGRDDRPVGIEATRRALDDEPGELRPMQG